LTLLMLTTELQLACNDEEPYAPDEEPMPVVEPDEEPMPLDEPVEPVVSDVRPVADEPVP